MCQMRQPRSLGLRQFFPRRPFHLPPVLAQRHAPDRLDHPEARLHLDLGLGPQQVQRQDAPLVTALEQHPRPVEDGWLVLDLIEPLALGDHPALCHLAQPPGRNGSRIGMTAARLLCRHEAIPRPDLGHQGAGLGRRHADTPTDPRPAQIEALGQTIAHRITGIEGRSVRALAAAFGTCR